MGNVLMTTGNKTGISRTFVFFLKSSLAQPTKLFRQITMQFWSGSLCMYSPNNLNDIIMKPLVTILMRHIIFSYRARHLTRSYISSVIVPTNFKRFRKKAPKSLNAHPNLFECVKHMRTSNRWHVYLAKMSFHAKKDNACWLERPQQPLSEGVSLAAISGSE